MRAPGVPWRCSCIPRCEVSSSAQQVALPARALSSCQVTDAVSQGKSLSSVQGISRIPSLKPRRARGSALSRSAARGLALAHRTSASALRRSRHVHQRICVIQRARHAHQRICVIQRARHVHQRICVIQRAADALLLPAAARAPSAPRHRGTARKGLSLCSAQVLGRCDVLPAPFCLKNIFPDR
jgi:hypothetical protein